MLPVASRIAWDVKFSLAINSRCEFWRSVSCRIASEISGSTSASGLAMRSCSVIVVLLSALVFQLGDFRDAARVTAAVVTTIVEGRLEERSHQFAGLGGICKPGPQGQHVRIVVRAGEAHLFDSYAQ